MRRELSQAGNFGVTFQRGNRKVLSSFRVCDKMSGTVVDDTISMKPAVLWNFLPGMRADGPPFWIHFCVDGGRYEI